MKTKNPKLQLLGVNCPHRIPNYPTVKTYNEQNIDVPPVYTFTLVSNKMDIEKRKEISNILNQSTIAIGKEEFFKLCECTPPNFQNINYKDYVEKRLNQTSKLLKKYEKEIKAGQQ